MLNVSKVGIKIARTMPDRFLKPISEKNKKFRFWIKGMNI